MLPIATMGQGNLKRVYNEDINPLEQIVIQLLNQFNILTMEFDSLFEMVCDTEEKKQAFKKIMEEKIKAYNEKESQCKLRLPDLKIVITGTQYGYKREDGVYVVPIGCLKD